MEQKRWAISQSQDREWMQNLPLIVEFIGHFNCLNMKLYGRNKLITDIYDSIHAFELKLQLWETAIRE